MGIRRYRPGQVKGVQEGSGEGARIAVVRADTGMKNLDRACLWA